MPRALRVEYPGAIYHVMDRGDRQDWIFLDDVDRQDFLKTLADAWQKSHPVKPAWAARLRPETALSVKQAAERLHLGKPKGARTNLYKFMHNSPTDRPQIQLET